MPTSLATTATGVPDAFTKIDTWITATLGWTLVDTISSTDKVYSSNGINADRPTIFMRLTQSLFDEAPGDFPQGAFDNVTTRLYRSWNAGTHSGTGEVGRFGRSHWIMPLSSNANNPPIARYLPESSTISLHADVLPNDNGLTTSSMSTNWRGYVQFMDGRLWWSPSSTASNQSTTGYNTPNDSLYHLRAFELATGNMETVGPSLFQPYDAFVLTVDKTNGRRYAWGFTSSQTTSGQLFYRYDFNLNTDTYMADPPWGAGAVSSNYAPMCWDGGDKIYAGQPKNSLVTGGLPFAVYTISTNSWVSLHAMPTTVGTAITGATGSSTYKPVYVPASLTGFATDRIYMLPPEQNANTTWWYYPVPVPADPAVTWVTSNGTSFLNLPVAKYSQGYNFIYLDPVHNSKGTIYYAVLIAAGASYVLWAYDLVNNSWSQCSNYNLINLVNISASPETLVLRQQLGQLVLPTASANLALQAVGNKDFICILATWTPPGSTQSIQRWMFAGFYNTYMKRDLFTTTAIVSPGTNVTITLSQTIGTKLVPGDTVELYDASASVAPPKGTTPVATGGGEVVTIVSIPDSTHVTVAQVTGTYPIGTILAQDASCAMVGNDGMLFADMQGARGYQGNFESDWYRAQIILPSTLTKLTGPRNVGIVSGIGLYNKQIGNGTEEWVGELPCIFTANPNSNQNDLDVNNTSAYLVFKKERQEYDYDPRLLAIGDTNA